MEYFGLDRDSACTEYRRFIKTGTELEDSPWNDLKGHASSVTMRFSKKLFPVLKEKSAFKEVPRIQRFAGRPSLESLLADTEGRKERDSAIVKACLGCGYTQARVAVATGLHYSNVGRIIRREESRFKT